MVTYQDAYVIGVVDDKGVPRNRVDPTMPKFIHAIVIHAACPGDAAVSINFNSYSHLLGAVQGACCSRCKKVLRHPTSSSALLASHLGSLHSSLDTMTQSKGQKSHALMAT